MRQWLSLAPRYQAAAHERRRPCPEIVSEPLSSVKRAQSNSFVTLIISALHHSKRLLPQSAIPVEGSTSRYSVLRMGPPAPTGSGTVRRLYSTTENKHCESRIGGCSHGLTRLDFLNCDCPAFAERAVVTRHRRATLRVALRFHICDGKSSSTLLVPVFDKPLKGAKFDSTPKDDARI
ncbi:hypothetical protein BDV18DRAFT_67578 [Aspergillus unguis]